MVDQIEKFLADDGARGELAESRAILATAVTDLQAMVASLTGYLMEAQNDARELYRVGLESVSFLLSVGDLLIGWLLLRQAEVALQALDGEPDEDDQAFYAGKVGVANFFVKNVLPRLSAERRTTEAVDLSLMQMREACF